MKNTANKSIGKRIEDFVFLIVVLGISILAGIALAEHNEQKESAKTISNNTNNMVTIDLSDQRYNDPIVILNDLTEVNTSSESRISELEVQVIDIVIEFEKAEVKKAEEYSQYEYKLEWIRDIPLEEKYQEYVYLMCNELNIKYDLSLAKIKLESQFDISARGYNKTEEGIIISVDVGLMQINDGNLRWCEELAGRKVDIYNNVYDNIECGLRIYKFYHDYWSNRGYTGYELNVRSLNSYNRGIQGYYDYMADGHGWDDWKYAKAVYINYNDMKEVE